ncbi:hypothetical protein V8G54_002657, partial [Vigna mungo]
ILIIFYVLINYIFPKGLETALYYLFIKIILKFCVFFFADLRINFTKSLSGHANFSINYKNAVFEPNCFFSIYTQSIRWPFPTRISSPPRTPPWTPASSSLLLPPWSSPKMTSRRSPPTRPSSTSNPAWLSASAQAPPPSSPWTVSENFYDRANSKTLSESPPPRKPTNRHSPLGFPCPISTPT